MAEQLKPIPICANCIYYLLPAESFHPICLNLQFDRYRLDPVDGGKITIKCFMARSTEVMCGSEGKYFRAAPNANKPNPQ